MRLWTMQYRHVLDVLEKDGVYRTDAALIDMPEFLVPYDWLCNKLNEKSPKPDNVQYPIWAWFRFNSKEKKPDLRHSCYGHRGDEMVCIELEIPDEYVLLSDFDLWHFVLNKWWLYDCFRPGYCDEDNEVDEAWFKSLTKEQQEIEKEKSWERIFNIEPFENDWIARGQYVQAVFWELRKEWVVKTQNFIAR